MSDSNSLWPLVAGGLAGAVSAGGLWAYSVFVPRCQFWAPVIRALPQRDGVALTFEDGPDSDVTPGVLGALEEAGVKATFFVIGRRAAEQPELVRRIFEAGHTLGNHSFDHDGFRLGHGRAYWEHQLGKTQRVVEEITGVAPVMFRPPGGIKTRGLAAAAGALKLPIVGWSVSAPEGGSGAEVAAGLLKRCTGHDIVLLRDGVVGGGGGGGVSRKNMVEGLPAFLAGLPEKKLRVVPLVEALVAAGEEMARRKGREAWRGE